MRGRGGGAVVSANVRAPELNWAEVKVVFDKKMASTNPEKVEKKVKTYGASRCDTALSGKCSSSPKDDAWTEDDE